MTSESAPFAELPAALVEEVLRQTSDVGDLLLGSFKNVRQERESLRQALLQRAVLMNESALGYPPLPTTCATDGSYAIERLLTADLAAAAAVALEGLTPPSEERHWDRPHHATFVAAEAHRAETATVLRAVMLGKELLLATRAPHDLVMLDGTLTLPVIYFNQALNQAPEVANLRCSEEFFAQCCGYLEAYLTVLKAERSDKHFIALPKYSTRREIGLEMGWPVSYDDRGLLTLLLRAGEFTKPRELEQPRQEWHFSTTRLDAGIRARVDALASEIVSHITRVHVLYYKPHDWLPALRVEVPETVALNSYRLGTVIQGLKLQCATSAMLEPYPLFLADRMVKALARALPAFRQAATQRISEGYDGDIGEVFFAMHGYRSESGGGG